MINFGLAIECGHDEECKDIGQCSEYLDQFTIEQRKEFMVSRICGIEENVRDFIFFLEHFKICFLFF